jgi:hypothetical protein
MISLPNPWNFVGTYIYNQYQAMTEGGGTKVGHGPPQIRKKKLEVTKIKNKNVKFDSNFSHLAPSQKLFGPIFRFYGHIQ